MISSRASVHAAAWALAAILSCPDTVLACASCGCTLNTDAASGTGSTEGGLLTLQYDLLNQNELRHGTGSAAPRDVVDRPADPSLGGAEIEQGTLTRFYTLGLGYNLTKNWRLDVRLPYIDRARSTYGFQPTPFSPDELSAQNLSTAHVSGIGDLKLVTTYQGFLPTRNLGLQLGLKLPTGSYGTATLFQSGPSAGTALDASLQAGTGSTDLIVGAFYFTAISQDFDLYTSAQLEAAITHAPHVIGNDFRPGNSQILSIGLRNVADPSIMPQVQLNLSHKGADQGALADAPNSGGVTAYVSPGITVSIAHHVHAYGFVQLPVYRNLDGYQLAPRWIGTLGLSWAF
jgi:hypothetical protein